MMRAKRHKNGTALVEAVIVAPAFALLLGSALALHSMYSAKLEAKERARRLAWLQADSGECPESSCSTADCQRVAGEIDSALSVESVAAAGLSLDTFLSNLRDFVVGGVTRGIARADAKTASIVRGGSTTQFGATELACNSRVRTAENGDTVLAHACRTGLRSADYAREVCR